MSNPVPDDAPQAEAAPAGPPIVISIATRPMSGVSASTVAMFLGLCLEKIGVTDIGIIEEEISAEYLKKSLEETPLQDRLKTLAEANPCVSIVKTQLPRVPRDTVQFILPPGVKQ